MTTTVATVNIRGREYTFNHDHRDMTGKGLQTLGSVYNSRGQWAGFVCRAVDNGNTIIIGAAGNSVPGPVMHRALAHLS